MATHILTSYPRHHLFITYEKDIHYSSTTILPPYPSNGIIKKPFIVHNKITVFHSASLQERYGIRYSQMPQNRSSAGVHRGFFHFRIEFLNLAWHVSRAATVIDSIYCIDYLYILFRMNLECFYNELRGI